MLLRCLVRLLLRGGRPVMQFRRVETLETHGDFAVSNGVVGSRADHLGLIESVRHAKRGVGIGPKAEGAGGNIDANLRSVRVRTTNGPELREVECAVNFQ